MRTLAQKKYKRVRIATYLSLSALYRKKVQIRIFQHNKCQFI